jgi:chromosome segregation ATPase
MLLYTVDGRLVNFLFPKKQIVEGFAGSVAPAPAPASEPVKVLTPDEIVTGMIKEWNDKFEWLDGCRMKHKVFAESLKAIKGNIGQVVKQQTALKQAVESTNKMMAPSGPPAPDPQSQITGDITEGEKQQFATINRETVAAKEKMIIESTNMRNTLISSTQDSITSHTNMLNDFAKNIEEKIEELKKIQRHAIQLYNEAQELQKERANIEKDINEMTQLLNKTKDVLKGNAACIGAVDVSELATQLDTKKKRLQMKGAMREALEKHRSAFEEIIMLVNQSVGEHYPQYLVGIKEYQLSIESLKGELAAVSGQK